MNPYSDMPAFVQEVYNEGDAWDMSVIHLISVCDYDNPVIQYWHDVV